MERTSRGTVLVTGANGYIGGAVARAFSRAGWRTYGLARRTEVGRDLARDEIVPVRGTSTDPSFLDALPDVAFDVVVSSTEDATDPAGHYRSVRSTVDAVAARRASTGARPLVLFTSGCKDYGPMRELDGDPGLRPHTEEDPLDPPPALAPRTRFGVELLEAGGRTFDAVVLRPTIVYGHSSSYYGALFALADAAEDEIVLTADPRSIMHAVHVDDCADAYVALAERPRGDVAQRAFNIANATYETAGAIGSALADLYGKRIRFVPPGRDIPFQTTDGLANFSQWVGSDRIRAVTGWTERRPSFIDGIDRYRLAYEATAQPAGDR